MVLFWSESRELKRVSNGPRMWRNFSSSEISNGENVIPHFMHSLRRYKGSPSCLAQATNSLTIWTSDHQPKQNVFKINSLFCIQLTYVFLRIQVWCEDTTPTTWPWRGHWSYILGKTSWLSSEYWRMSRTYSSWFVSTPDEPEEYFVYNYNYYNFVSNKSESPTNT